MEKVHNSEDLAYFISLQSLGASDDGAYSREKWDRRAEHWQRERVNHRKGDERIVSAMTYLEQRGVLQKEYAVADIGCGPGRFAAAFAKRVHRVVGLDISEKMILHGREHIRKEGLENALLYPCDFQTLDIQKEGYEKAFDLVFGSMTPAVHDMEGLMKFMAMSRSWCCQITHLSGQNLLRDQIMREVFDQAPSGRWTGRWFYSLFNILFLLGYHPETSYEHHRRELLIRPDEEYVEFIMEHMLPSEEITKENWDKVMGWLLAHRDEEGFVREITDSSYARILWDVRDRRERPDYRVGDRRA